MDKPISGKSHNNFTKEINFYLSIIFFPYFYQTISTLWRWARSPRRVNDMSIPQIGETRKVTEQNEGCSHPGVIQRIFLPSNRYLIPGDFRGIGNPDSALTGS